MVGLRQIGSEVQKLSCVSTEQFGLGVLRQIALAYQSSCSFFAQRKRIIRAHKHPISSHRSYQKLQRELVEHCGVCVEAVEIVARWVLALTPRNRMMMPGIFQ